MHEMGKDRLVYCIPCTDSLLDAPCLGYFKDMVQEVGIVEGNLLIAGYKGVLSRQKRRIIPTDFRGPENSLFVALISEAPGERLRSHLEALG
jgi:hypothetical protein